MSEVRVSIHSKRPSFLGGGGVRGGGGGGGDGLNLKRKVPPPRAPPPSRREVEEQEEEKEEEEEETKGEALLESAKQSKRDRYAALHNGGGGCWWLIVPIGIGITCFTIIIVFIIIFTSRSTTAHTIELKRDQNKWEIMFNLIPDDTSTGGRIMTLSLRTMVFDRLQRYDLCCFQQSIYACRSITKNVGADCYLTRDKTAVITIGHPELVGARCKIMWTETS